MLNKLGHYRTNAVAHLYKEFCIDCIGMIQIQIVLKRQLDLLLVVFAIE